MLLLSKQRTFSLIFNLLAPNDALEAPGVEGRWQGERSLWMGQTPLILTTSLISFEAAKNPQRFVVASLVKGTEAVFGTAYYYYR